MARALAALSPTTTSRTRDIDSPVRPSVPPHQAFSFTCQICNSTFSNSNAFPNPPPHNLPPFPHHSLVHSLYRILLSTSTLLPAPSPPPRWPLYSSRSFHTFASSHTRCSSPFGSQGGVDPLDRCWSCGVGKLIFGFSAISYRCVNSREYESTISVSRFQKSLHILQFF